MVIDNRAGRRPAKGSPFFVGELRNRDHDPGRKLPRILQFISRYHWEGALKGQAKRDEWPVSGDERLEQGTCSVRRVLSAKQRTWQRFVAGREILPAALKDTWIQESDGYGALCPSPLPFGQALISGEKPAPRQPATI